MKKPTTAGPGGAASPASAASLGAAASPGSAAGPDGEDATRDGSDHAAGAAGEDLNATLARTIWQFIAEVSKSEAVPSAT